ncbi:MAG: pilus assembly protein [Alphaproteobacteria bacterium]|nr:pilus assembly protein [Alphaproteobacteria bacterium]
MPATRSPIHLLQAREGTVAIEFAFIAPILILLFLGTIELCNALICHQKVTTMAASASDLVAQDEAITGTQLSDVFTAVNAIMYPFPTSGSRIIVTSVKQNPGHTGQYLVDWSVPFNTTAHTVGAAITIPSGLVTNNSSVIMTEISYTYTPPSNAVIRSSFTMSDTFYSKPRKSNFVVYTP